jgi:serine/threonine-protein kinase
MNIPGYKLVREISAGPLTSVYLCKQLSLDREVLLKVLHPQHAADKEIVNRFVREAKLYAQLHHPNIVEVYDTGQENGYFYIAMRYIRGWSLDEFIRAYAPLRLDISLYIMKNILTGLQYAHNAGIIHRDIKPSNILIGKDSSIKLTDFGLAKPLNLPAITAQGTAIGTPAYMPPEVAKGQPADQRGDFFSTGATFYELFAGFSPFMGKSIGESIHKVLNTTPASLKQIRDDVPKWCDKLILNMLDKNPKRRPKSCTDVLRQLESGLTESALQFIDPDFIRNVVEAEIIHEVMPSKNGPIKSIRGFGIKRILYVGIVLISISLILWFSLGDSRLSETESPVAAKNDIKTDHLNTDSVSASNMGRINQSEPVLNLTTQRINNLNDLIPVEVNRKDIDVNNEPSETAQGFLFVAAIPWADVYIDGEKTETTPLKKAIMLDPGSHLVELRNPNFKQYSQNVNVQSGAIDSLLIQLESLMGFLRVNVIPWGEIYLNEKYIDTTPLKEPIKVNAGFYRLMIKNPNYNSYQKEIEIKSGQTEQIDINLQR